MDKTKNIKPNIKTTILSDGSRSYTCSYPGTITTQFITLIGAYRQWIYINKIHK